MKRSNPSVLLELTRKEPSGMLTVVSTKYDLVGFDIGRQQWEFKRRPAKADDDGNETLFSSFAKYLDYTRGCLVTLNRDGTKSSVLVRGVKP